MALVTTKEMFEKALNADYAVGAFNVNNMEIIQGIVDAAKEEAAPLILQVSAGARKYAKPAYLMKLVEAAILDTGLDIALHLDHGEVPAEIRVSSFPSFFADSQKRSVNMMRLIHPFSQEHVSVRQPLHIRQL